MHVFFGNESARTVNPVGERGIAEERENRRKKGWGLRTDWVNT